MTGSDNQGRVSIEVVYALPEEQQLVTINLPAGSCVQDALEYVLEHNLIALAANEAMVKPHELPVGVYGQSVDKRYVLKAGDRLEIYRPLLQDPKERRRKMAGKSRSG